MGKGVVLDLYTDEPAGLGVPPYLGTYPRYIAGIFNKQGHDVSYLTIDDFRYYYNYDCKVSEVKVSQKSNIKIRNLTFNKDKVGELLENADVVAVSGGAHTSGKYLSALPGNLNEILDVFKQLNCEKILAGPMASEFGSSYVGGKHVKMKDISIFDKLYFAKSIKDYSEIRESALKGAFIVNQIPYPIVCEIETSNGCPRDNGCSFCTEPLKGKPVFREQVDIIEEVKELVKLGMTRFRLGKQTCFYSYKGGEPEEIERLLKPLHELNLEMLHIDNVNPANVVSKNGRKITEMIVKYCTEGNVAAFGIESFDPVVIRENNLNTSPEMAFEAVKILNEIGGEVGENGMPKYLPGINILLGLKGENRETLEMNLEALKKIYDAGYMVRRINIRQVVPYHGTLLHETSGDKFIKKNKKRYYSFRKKVREQVDNPMLERVVPRGRILKGVFTEVWDGKKTFGRQFGSYPLIVGIEQRLDLDKFIDVRVKGYMLRSIIGEKVNE